MKCILVIEEASLDVSTSALRLSLVLVYQALLIAATYTSKHVLRVPFSMSALAILPHLTILGRAGEFRFFRTESGEHSLMPTAPRKRGVHHKTCSTSPVVAARCHTGSPLSALDMRLLRTQKFSPEMEEYMANDTAEGLFQPIRAAFPGFDGDVLLNHPLRFLFPKS
jgi:hypothetical protein